jgi:hypothetical protein
MAHRDRIQASLTSVMDFDPKCKCGNVAVSYMEIHPLDYCTPERPTWAALLCRACLTRDVSRVRNILADGPVWRSSCGAQIVTLSGILVKVCPLWATGG